MDFLDIFGQFDDPHIERKKLHPMPEILLLTLCAVICGAESWDDIEMFGKEKNHINGIENFWNQAKRVLRKYNGIPKESFPLFLKECEFRFNYGTPKQQLKTLKEWADI